jgi:hypothetical protein
LLVDDFAGSRDVGLDPDFRFLLDGSVWASVHLDKVAFRLELDGRGDFNPDLLLSGWFLLLFIGSDGWNNFLDDFLDGLNGDFLGLLGLVSSNNWDLGGDFLGFLDLIGNDDNFLGNFLDSFDGSFLGFLFLIGNDGWDRLGDWNNIFQGFLFGFNWKWVDLDDMFDMGDLLFFMGDLGDDWDHLDDLLLCFIFNSDWNNFLDGYFFSLYDWDNIFLGFLFNFSDGQRIDLDDLDSIFDNWDLFFLDNWSDDWDHQLDDLLLGLIFNNGWNNFLDGFFFSLDGWDNIFLGFLLFNCNDGQGIDLDDIFNNWDLFFLDNWSDDWNHLDDLFISDDSSDRFGLGDGLSDGLDGRGGFLDLGIGNWIDGHEFDNSLGLIDSERNNWNLDDVGLDRNGFSDRNWFGNWNWFGSGFSNLESSYGNLDGLDDFLDVLLDDLNNLDRFFNFDGLLNFGGFGGQVGDDSDGLDFGFLDDFLDGGHGLWLLIVDESFGDHQGAELWLDEILLGLLGRFELGLGLGSVESVLTGRFLEFGLLLGFLDLLVVGSGGHEVADQLGQIEFLLLVLLQIVVVVQDKDDRFMILQILTGVGRHDGDNALRIWLLPIRPE